MEPLYFLGIAMLVAVPFTALVCRQRLARKRQISYGTMLAGAFSATLFTFVCAFAYEAGWDMFTRQFWIDEFTIPSKDPAGLIWVVLGFVNLMCVLPALGVAIYYQAMSRRERPVA